MQTRAPYIQPMQRALDRVQQRPVFSPEVLERRAEALLEERFGASDGLPAAGLARGSMGLLAAHTHYSDGFALLLPLAQATAVALRQAAGSRTRLAFEGSDETWSFEASGAAAEAPPWVQLVAATVCSEGQAFDAAVVSAVPAACRDAYMAALGVAAARALRAAASEEAALQNAALEDVRARLEAATGFPFSIAFPMAAAVAQPGTLTLVDTATREHLPVDAPAPDVLGRGLLDVGGRVPRGTAFHQARRAQAGEALAALRAHGFERLTAFRNLEHRDLGRAEETVPSSLKPLVRHLVTENRRVQRAVAAVRRADWQLFGALLLMSHASFREVWQGSTARHDAAVEIAEAMSMDGVYGACASGRGSCVLVAGRPFVLPAYLDRTAALFKERFGQPPEAVLL